MVDRKNIQIDLIKLMGGERLLRLTEPQSGLALEKKLNPKKPSRAKRKNSWCVRCRVDTSRTDRHVTVRIWLTFGRNVRMNGTSAEIAELVRQKLMSCSGSERLVMEHRCSMLRAGRKISIRWFERTSQSLVGLFTVIAKTQQVPSLGSRLRGRRGYKILLLSSARLSRCD